MQSVARADYTLAVQEGVIEDNIYQQLEPLADYLSERLNEPVVLRQFTHQQLIDALSAQESIDLFLVDPILFEQIHHQVHQISKLATLEYGYQQQRYAQSAGVILSADSTLSTLKDLEGQTILYSHPNSLTGFNAQRLELQGDMVNLTRIDFQEVGSEGLVMQRLLEGRARVGFVSSQVYHNWQQRSETSLKLSVLSKRSHSDFPFLHSTELYPNWVFAVKSSLTSERQNVLEQALLDVGQQLPSLQALGIAGFSDILSFHEVESLMVKLAIPPYGEGEASQWEHWLSNYPWLSIVASMLALLFVWLLWSNYALRNENHQQALKFLDRMQRLLNALGGKGTGVWRSNLYSGQFELNSHLAHLLGLSERSIVLSEQEWVALIHPNDFVELQKVMQQHIKGLHQGFHCEVRLRHESGQWIWTLLNGVVVMRDDNEQPIVIAGNVKDIRKNKIYDRIQKLKNARDQVMLKLPKQVEKLPESEFVRYTLRELEELTESEFSFAYSVNLIHSADDKIEYEKERVVWSNSLLSACPNLIERDCVFHSGLLDDVLSMSMPRVVNKQPFRFENFECHYHPLVLNNYILMPLLQMGHVVMVIGVCNRQELYTHEQREAVSLIAEQMFRLMEGRRQLFAIQNQQQYLSRLLEDIGEQYAVFSQSPSGAIKFLSESIEGILGVSKERVIACGWHSAVNWIRDDIMRLEISMKSLGNQILERDEINVRFITERGDLRTLRIRSHVTLNEINRVTSIDGIIEDITQSVHEQAALKQAASVFEHAQESILVLDAFGCITQANHAFIELTGYDANWVIGRSPKFLHSRKQSIKDYRKMIYQLQLKGTWSGELWGRKKNGNDFYYRITLSVVRNEVNQLEQVVVIIGEMTDQKLYQDQVEYLAHHDPLTGLANRTLFVQKLEQAFAIETVKNQQLCVVFIDLDGFKEINDTHSHDAGDHLLKIIAKRLNKQVREHDIVSRLGGDEFVVLMQGIESSDVLHTRLQQMLEKLNQPISYNEHPLKVSASMGVSLSPHPDIDTPEQMLRQADQLMYRAKKSGKNCIVYA